MAVNKLKVRVNQIKDGVYDRQILFPLGQSYDEVGRGDLIGVYEDETIDKLVGIKRDYEVTRYTHAPLENGDPSPNLFYNFMFGSLDSILNTFTTTFPSAPTLAGGWGTTNPPCPTGIQDFWTQYSDNPIYLPPDPLVPATSYGYDFQTFTPEETYKSNKNFTKSFFKLDLYNSMDRKKTKIIHQYNNKPYERK